MSTNRKKDIQIQNRIVYTQAVFKRVLQIESAFSVKEKRTDEINTISNGDNKKISQQLTDHLLIKTHPTNLSTLGPF